MRCMTKKLLFFCLIVLQFLSNNEVSKAQGVSKTQFADTLVAIENSSISDFEKIKKLHSLQNQYLKFNNNIRDSIYARIIHRLGNRYRLSGDLERAIKYTKEAININASPRKETEKSFLVNSYFNLGLCYWEESLFTVANNYFDSCINLGGKYPDKLYILPIAFEKKVYGFFQTGDYQKSIEIAEKGILFAKKITDTLYEAILLSLKSQSQLELNNLTEAENNIQKAIFIIRKNKNSIDYIPTAYSIYAKLLIAKNDLKTAIKYYEKSFLLNNKNNYWSQCSRDMLDLGYLYDNQMHNYLKANNSYNEGIKMAEKANDTYLLTALYLNKGVIYWHQQKFKDALLLYQKALNVLPIHFSDTSIRSNPTEKMLKQVANDYFVSTLLSNKGEALLESYKTSKDKKFLQYSLNTFKIANKSVDLMRWKQYGEQSKLFWREKTRQMYENAIEVCFLLNDFEQGFYFFEKSRAVLLNDKLSELGAKNYISQSDRTKEQQLRIKVSSLNQQLSFLDEAAAAYNNTKSQLLSAQDDLEKFIKNLEKKYPVYYQYKYNNAVYPLHSVKNKLLAKNQSLIEYFTGDSAIYVLYLSHTNNRFLKIPFKNYVAVTKEMMTLCSDRSLLNQNYARYCALAYRLYDRLFKPLQVPEGRVIISPDEYFIPFESLLSDAAVPNSFLIKKYAFSYAYSAGLLMKSNERASYGNSFLGIAPVDFQPRLNQQSLDGADLSLDNIKPYFQTADFLIKEQASKQQFLKNISQYDIVQIYSHADADSSGKQPVLYLHDSALNISEIQTLENLKTDLIVLSACKTGFGKNAKGEGIFSLARAFMAAGIPSTVTTLWQVDNKATYQLTEAFYKYLSLGLTKDVAMQKAKLELMQSNDKTYELPYYWAADILLGKTNIINKKPTLFSFPYILIFIAGILAIIAISIFAYKKIGIKKEEVENKMKI